MHNKQTHTIQIPNEYITAKVASPLASQDDQRDGGTAEFAAFTLCAPLTTIQEPRG